MQAIHTAVIQSAVQLGLEDGKQLRVDTTVVETDIHFPTDATLSVAKIRSTCRIRTLGSVGSRRYLTLGLCLVRCYNNVTS